MRFVEFPVYKLKSKESVRMIYQCHEVHFQGNEYTFKEGNSVRIVLLPFEKVHSKREEFAPTGSKFFPFKVDPFSEETGIWKSK